MSERSPIKGRISAEQKAQKRAAALRENLKKRKMPGKKDPGQTQSAHENAQNNTQDHPATDNGDA